MLQLDSPDSAQEVSEAEEKLGHIGTYTLNDYLLPRGFANLYVSGVGTKDSEGTDDQRRLSADRGI